MSESSQEATLTLKDRINYPYILADAILTLHKAVLNQEYSEREITEAIKNLWTSIPDAWEDPQFRKDVAEATMEDKIDVRPEFCGQKMSVEQCLKHGIKTEKPKKSYDYDKLKRACINLLNRRGMLGKELYLEKMVPEPKDFEPADS